MPFSKNSDVHQTYFTLVTRENSRATTETSILTWLLTLFHVWFLKTAKNRNLQIIIFKFDICTLSQSSLQALIMLQKQIIMSAPADMMPPPPTSTEYGQGDGFGGVASNAGVSAPPMMPPMAPPANGGFQIKQVFVVLSSTIIQTTFNQANRRHYNQLARIAKWLQNVCGWHFAQYEHWW